MGGLQKNFDFNHCELEWLSLRSHNFVYESASLIPKIPRETAWNGDSKGIEICRSMQRGSYVYAHINAEHFFDVDTCMCQRRLIG